MDPRRRRSTWPEFDGRSVAGRRLHPALQRLPPVLPGGVRLRAAAATRPIDEAGELYNMAGTAAGRSGRDLGFDETGAGNQDNSATFVGDQLAARPGALPALADRAARRVAAAGCGAVRAVQRPQYMAAGADSRGYKRLARRSTCRREQRATRLPARPTTSSRTTTTCSSKCTPSTARRTTTGPRCRTRTGTRATTSA